MNGKDRLLQEAWAKDSLIVHIMPPTANKELDARLAILGIILIPD